MEKNLNFKIIRYDFLNMVNGSLSKKIHQFCFIVWILLIILYKIDSFKRNMCSLSNVLNQNVNFYQMDFWFELFTIHMNEKWTICYDCYGFKW